MYLKRSAADEDEDDDDEHLPGRRKRSKSIGEELFSVHLKRSQDTDSGHDTNAPNDPGDRNESNGSADKENTISNEPSPVSP